MVAHALVMATICAHSEIFPLNRGKHVDADRIQTIENLLSGLRTAWLDGGGTASEGSNIVAWPHAGKEGRIDPVPRPAEKVGCGPKS
jgi:hypothetical protein